MIIRKSPDEIEKMAAAGAILARCHAILRSKARPGVTTLDLDAAAERFIRSQGAEPAFKGYRGFPGSICASPNSMVVHGIPGTYELQRGDILSIDVGVVLDGWVADARDHAPDRQRHADRHAPAAHHPGVAVRRGRAVPAWATASGTSPTPSSARVEADGFAVIRSLVGHGIGREMHEDPQIPNFGDPGTGPELEEGMVLAIEPMVNAGEPPRPHGLRTTGRSTRRTARWRPISSTPWRLPPRAPASSPRGTLVARSAQPRLQPDLACYSCRSRVEPSPGLRAVLVSIRSRTEL